MFENYTVLLSLIVFLPALGALVLAFVPAQWTDVHRYLALACTIGVCLLCVMGLMVSGDPFASSGPEAAFMQKVFNHTWIPSFNIDYFMGMDGISFPLIILTAVISLLAMGASWSITKHVKAYCILYLLLVTGMLGVFLSLDFFLFYVFWEVMLLPMYFLIGVWGGPRREYAAIKFFLYTLVGSVLMLIAILLLYFNSDVQQLAAASNVFGNRQAVFNGSQLQLIATEGGEEATAVDWSRLHLNRRVEQRLGIARAPRTFGNDVAIVRTGGEQLDQPLTLQIRIGDSENVNTTADGLEVVVPTGTSLAQLANALEGNDQVALIVPESAADRTVTQGVRIRLPAVDRDETIHTFNLLALAAMGQHTNAISKDLQIWAFVLLFIGFIIKVPSVPLHTWLPDAHVEAPTPISMILAGVLLKMGGYGIIRICYPICPFGGYELAMLVCVIGVVSMVYGAFAALAQTDFKRLVAYSSVSHMGYVVLGLGVWSARGTDALMYNTNYWNQGVQGAMFQMIAHGISSAGMFFMVGVVYDRVHHRNLNEFGGLFGKMPVYTAFAIGIFFAGLGLPGLCGFIGEVFVVLSSWNFNQVLAVISAAVVILTAAYILWTLQRVYLGPAYRGPHEDHLTPSTLRENVIAGTLFVLAILFGIFPYKFFNQVPSLLAYMEPTITRQVNDLADWTERQQRSGDLDVDETQVAQRAHKVHRVDEEREAGLAAARDAKETGTGEQVANNQVASNEPADR